MKPRTGGRSRGVVKECENAVSGRSKIFPNIYWGSWKSRINYPEKIGIRVMSEGICAVYRNYDIILVIKPEIFTRNGYGCMVAMSHEVYKRLNDPIVFELNRADAKKRRSQDEM